MGGTIEVRHLNIYVKIGQGRQHPSHSKQDEEGDHQTEETHGFGESKAQDGIRKKLLF